MYYIFYYIICFFLLFFDTYQSSQRIRGSAASRNTIPLLFERTEPNTNLISQLSLLPAAALCHRSVSLLQSLCLEHLTIFYFFISRSLSDDWFYRLFVFNRPHVGDWSVCDDVTVPFSSDALQSYFPNWSFSFFFISVGSFDEWIYHTCHWYHLYQFYHLSWATAGFSVPAVGVAGMRAGITPEHMMPAHTSLHTQIHSLTLPVASLYFFSIKHESGWPPRSLLPGLLSQKGFRQVGPKELWSDWSQLLSHDSWTTPVTTTSHDS